MSMAEYYDGRASLDDKRELLTLIQESHSRNAYNRHLKEVKLKGKDCVKAYFSKENFPNTPEYILHQNFLMEIGMSTEARKEYIKGLYDKARAAKVGTKILCPCCEVEMVKKTYHHVFCKEKLARCSSCKDFYHNFVPSERHNRTLEHLGKNPVKELPEPYVDCVILTVDGVKRIARLNHDKTYWQLSTYNKNKHDYVLTLDRVKDFKVIDMEI